VDNLYITPRLGSYTRESRLRASWYVAHRIHEALTAPAKVPDAPVSSAGELEVTGVSSGAEPQFIIR
jgi:D-3-phosphoglycerate dehydrogenase